MIPKRPVVIPVLACLLIALTSGGCVMQRTVSENGNVVSQDYIVERPIRDAIRESGD